MKKKTCVIGVKEPSDAPLHISRRRARQLREFHFVADHIPKWGMTLRLASAILIVTGRRSRFM